MADTPADASDPRKWIGHGHADKALERRISVIEAQLYKALIDGQNAEKAGNSPAAGASLSLFNSNYAALAALLPSLK